jgi:hypothetical protein
MTGISQELSTQAKAIGKEAIFHSRHDAATL